MSVLKHYFVDEAGDPVLYNRWGDLVAGQAGCSRYFILGFLDISNPTELEIELSQLRNSMLADPYFKKVPSFQPERKKTYLCFHAKDDIAEVRKEVFHLLMRHDLRFFAEVQDKWAKHK